MPRRNRSSFRPYSACIRPRDARPRSRGSRRSPPGTLANDEEPIDRIRARLREVREREPDVEVGYSIDDPWELMLLVALCRRYGLRPLRRPRQRSSTVRLLAPKSFMTNTLWPEFLALADALRNHLFRFTDATIREAIYDDAIGATASVPAPDPTPGKSALRPDLDRRAGAAGTVQQRGDEHTTGSAGLLHVREVRARRDRYQHLTGAITLALRQRTITAPRASKRGSRARHGVGGPWDLLVFFAPCPRLRVQVRCCTHRVDRWGARGRPRQPCQRAE